MLQPCVTELLLTSPEILKETYGQNTSDFVGLVASVFDITAHKDLSADKDGIWSSYCDLLAYLVKSSMSVSASSFQLSDRSVAHRSATNLILQNLERGLFKALTADRQFELCDLLLELSNHDQDVVCSRL